MLNKETIKSTLGLTEKGLSNILTGTNCEKNYDFFFLDDTTILVPPVMVAKDWIMVMDVIPTKRKYTTLDISEMTIWEFISQIDKISLCDDNYKYATVYEEMYEIIKRGQKVFSKTIFKRNLKSYLKDWMKNYNMTNEIIWENTGHGEEGMVIKISNTMKSEEIILRYKFNDMFVYDRDKNVVSVKTNVKPDVQAIVNFDFMLNNAPIRELSDTFKKFFFNYNKAWVKKN